MSLLLGALLVALLGAAWVIYPLVFGCWGLMGDVVPAEVVEREARKRVALAALKDVEYDRVSGKLDEADYRAVRSKLEMEALEALRAADGIGAPSAESASAPSAEDGRHGCGYRNPTGSRFCAGCGKPLT